MQPIQSTFSSSSTFVNANETIVSAGVISSSLSFPYVMQIGNVEEQISTIHGSYPTETQTHPVHDEQQTEGFKFNIVREPVHDETWSSFRQHNDRSAFIQLYNDFLLTSWEPSEQHKYNLKIAQDTITRNRDDSHEGMVRLYDALVEVLFYTDLRCRASFLIKSIIDLYKNNLILNNPMSFGKKRAREAQANIICQINKHHEHTYNATYLKLINYRNVLAQDKVLANIIKLKNEIQNLRGSTTKFKRDISILGKAHLPLVNYILDALRNNQKVTDQAITTLLAKQAPNQKISQPPRKKRRKDKNSELDNQLIPPKSQKSSGTVGSAGSAAFSQASSFDHSIEPYLITEFLPWQAPEQATGSDEIEVDTNDPMYKAILQDLHSCELSISTQSQLTQNEEASSSSFFQAAQREVFISPQQTVVHTSNLKTSAATFYSLYTLNTYQTQLLYAASPLSEGGMLISLLKKISEQGLYSYDSTKVFNEDKDICPEKYYNSLQMLSALNAEVLLLKIKNMVAELLKCEKITDHVGITNVRRRISKCLTFLIKNHKIHQKIELILQNEKMNELPQGMLFEDITSNLSRILVDIKNTQLLLAKIQYDYDTIIANNNEKNLLDRLRKLINEKLTLISIKRNFSLSRPQIKQLTQAFFNIHSDSNLTEEQLSKLKFKIAREPVKKNFWKSLRVEMDKSAFRKHYFDFIFTSWDNPAYVTEHVDMKINIAKKTGDHLNWCKLLIERCFQEKMRSQAFHLIHYILNLIKFRFLLKDLPKASAATSNAERAITMNLNKIINNSNLTFQIYSNYLKEREEPQINKISDLHAEIESSPRYIYNKMASDTKETSKHILLINKILEELEKNEFFDIDTILGLINESIKDTESQSEASVADACTFESDAPSNHSQLQFTSSIFEEPIAQHNGINFARQSSASQRVENNIAEDAQNLTDEQGKKEQLLGFIFEPTERTDFTMQIGEHLDMDERYLLDIFHD